MPRVYVTVDESGEQLEVSEARPESGLVLEVKGPVRALRAWSGLPLARKPRKPRVLMDYSPKREMGPLDLVAWVRVRALRLRAEGRFDGRRVRVHLEDNIARDLPGLDVTSWLEGPAELGWAWVRLDHPDLVRFHAVSS